MAELQNIANTVSCGLTSFLGGGDEGCSFEFDNFSGGQVRLWKKGHVIPKDTVKDRAFMRAQQRAGNLKVLRGIYGIEWTPSENSKGTSDDSGLSRVTRRGIYSGKVMFSKGIHSHKQFDSISLNDYWSIELTDGSGNELFTTTVNGDYKGMDTSYVVAAPLQLKVGSNVFQTGIEFELSNSTEVDKRLAYNKGESLDYGNDLDGINDAAISIPVAPADGETVINVKAVLLKDGSFHSGLIAADVLVKKSDGSTISATIGTADEAAKTYPLTIAAMATGEVYTVSYYDSSANSGVILRGVAPNDKLFKSNPATTVVVA